MVITLVMSSGMIMMVVLSISGQILKWEDGDILPPLRFCEFGGSSSDPDVKDRDAGCVPDTPKEGSFADGSLEWPSKFTKPKRGQYSRPWM